MSICVIEGVIWYSNKDHWLIPPAHDRTRISSEEIIIDIHFALKKKKKNVWFPKDYSDGSGLVTYIYTPFLAYTRVLGQMAELVLPWAHQGHTTRPDSKQQCLEFYSKDHLLWGLKWRATDSFKLCYKTGPTTRTQEYWFVSWHRLDQPALPHQMSHKRRLLL